MAKRIGGKKHQVEPEDIELVVQRGDDTEVHQFRIKPAASAGDMFALVGMMRTENMANMVRIGSMLRRVMDNTDGLVPADWRPVALPLVYRNDEGDTVPLPTEEELDDLAPEARSDIQERSLPRSYRGPDGAIHPFTDEDLLRKFTDPANGTSRRRWVYLLAGWTSPTR
jgi:hypothetical protein